MLDRLDFFAPFFLYAALLLLPWTKRCQPVRYRVISEVD